MTFREQLPQVIAGPVADHTYLAGTKVRGGALDLPSLRAVTDNHELVISMCYLSKSLEQGQDVLPFYDLTDIEEPMPCRQVFTAASLACMVYGKTDGWNIDDLVASEDPVPLLGMDDRGVKSRLANSQHRIRLVDCSSPEPRPEASLKSV